MERKKRAQKDRIEETLNEWDFNNIHLSGQYDVDIDFFSGDADGAATSLDSILDEDIVLGNDFSIDFSDEQGINDLFNPVRKAKTFKVKNAKELNQKGFMRIANSEFLIHKSTRDLWTLRKDGTGFIVEQLFEDEEEPLKDTF